MPYKGERSRASTSVNDECLILYGKDLCISILVVVAEDL